MQLGKDALEGTVILNANYLRAEKMLTLITEESGPRGGVGKTRCRSMQLTIIVLHLFNPGAYC